MTDIILNGVALSDQAARAMVLKVTRQLLGDQRDIREPIPGRAGSWVFDEQPGDRLISIDVNIEGYNNADRRNSVAAVATWADLPAPAPLIIDDQDDRYWLAKLDTPPAPDEWINAADLTLDFRASPYAYAVDLSTHDESLTDATPASFAIGDLVNAYPVIEVTAGETMADGFTLTVNGLVLVYGTALATSDVVTVSSLSYTVATGVNTDSVLTGAFVAGDLSMADLDGDFPVLKPGSNSIQIDGGDADVTIIWRRRYR